MEQAGLLTQIIEGASEGWNKLSRGTRRTLISAILFLDASIGLRLQFGSLNVLDIALLGNIPNDMVWLLQLVQSISAVFLLIKVIFDDAPAGPLRSVTIAASPILILLSIWTSLELLFQGLSEDATITIDFASLGLGTLTWSSTYLAIAIGLTLTYKVQRYGNFAQSELFMIGMYVALAIIWSDHFFPIYDAPADRVLVWTPLVYSIVGAFFFAGFAGVMIDRLIYRGFREKKASPQIMMIASLGVALALRAVAYLRFGSAKKLFEPDADWRVPSLKWDVPTQKMRLNLGVRDLRGSEDANGNGVFDVQTYTQSDADSGLIPLGSEIGDIIPGTGEDLDGDGRFDINPETYSHGSCEQVGVNDSGEPIYERVVSEGWSHGSQTPDQKPLLELYDVSNNCLEQATTGYAYYKGAMPVVIFSAVLILMLLLRKTRLGRRMRAVADNPDLAASSGINVEKIHLTSAFLSAGVSGMGGAIFALTVRYNPETAFTLLLPSFAVIVLGTIGSIEGAIVGALVIGFVRSLSTPVLVGIGLPLGRSNYTSMEAVMPYVFLVAILLILPEGIGSAYEKWKVDRLRRRAESKREPSKNLIAALAISPLGALGIHNYRNRKPSRGESMLAITTASYVISRIAAFISKNSFADGSCSDYCSENESYSSNLQIITGRTDGALSPIDSPFEDPSTSESWYDLMITEIDLVNLAASVGDVVWPWAPILIWMIAVVQGVSILLGKKEDPLDSLVEAIGRLSSSISIARQEAALYLSNALSPIQSAFTDFRESAYVRIQSKSQSTRENISQLFNGLSERAPVPLKEYLSKTRDSIPNSLIQHRRESNLGSWIAFWILLALLILSTLWLPVSEGDDARLRWLIQISSVAVTLSIFILMSFSLNLHTGISGMVNFGVIFFVAVGAITVSILTVPSQVNGVDIHGYGWPIYWAVLAGVLVSAVLGWLLAYPTARLRMDYFAIVTISLGEILRVLLIGEPLLRAGTPNSALGISRFDLPLKGWWFCGDYTPVDEAGNLLGPDNCRSMDDLETPASWVGEVLGLGEAAPYMFLLAMIGIFSTIAIWWLLDTILSSPWGRILRSIREDEEVAQHHGHDVLTHKASSLALGAAIAAFAGALWAWKLTGIQPSFLAPARSTFLVWAAFIIGGSANNRGMVIGAFIIVLMEYVFNVLVAAQGSDTLPLHETANQIDSFFEWLVTEEWEVVRIFAGVLLAGLILGSRTLSDLGVTGIVVMSFSALVLGQYSLDQSFFGGNITANMAYVKVLLVGLLIVFSLKFNPKGLLPEVPNRPDRVIGGETE